MNAEELKRANQFVDVAACGDVDGVKELLLDETLTSAMINKIDKDGRSALHYSCLNDDVKLVKVLLADERIDVSLRSPRGDSCMHMASLYAAQSALREILGDARGRDLLNSQNKYLETPLHLCAGSGDKGAAKTALILLEAGASMTMTDQWHRGPLDVSRENAENPLVKVFEEHLASRPDLSQAVAEVTAKHKDHAERPVHNDSANKAAKAAIFGQLGQIKLKKSATAEKNMFAAQKVSNAIPTLSKATDGRRALSKLIDFPGDIDEIRRHLANRTEIDPAAADAYGLTALMKFASWNKDDYIRLLVPHLSQAELDAKDPSGKTALHYAVEMASAAAVKALVAAGVNPDATDANGRTVKCILDSQDQESEIIRRLQLALKVVSAA